MASGGESDDTVRILKDIRDEIRNARNELRDEIRGVRTERVDRPDGGRKTRWALFVLGVGVAGLAGALLIWRAGGNDGGRVGTQKVGGQLAAIAAAPMPDPPIAASPPPMIAVPAAPAPAAQQVAAAAAPKRAPARHKARPPTEAELEEPAKL